MIVQAEVIVEDVVDKRVTAYCRVSMYNTKMVLSDLFTVLWRYIVQKATIT